MAEPVQGDLVINEVLFDPNTGGSDFVEIFNRSNKTIDLRHVLLANRNKADGSIQQIHACSSVSYFVESGSYLALTADPSGVSNFYRVQHPEMLVGMAGFPTYAKDAGTVVLLNTSQAIIDEFTYSDKMHFALLANKQGVSLERINYMRPSSESANWHSAAQDAGFATPTYQNSQFSENPNFEDQTFMITPKIFSPDGDGRDESLFIDYHEVAEGSMLNVRIYNLQGQLIQELARGLLLGTEGRLMWDGLTSDKRKAAIGVYIIHIEMYDLKGTVKVFKKTCVLAGRR